MPRDLVRSSELRFMGEPAVGPLSFLEPEHERCPVITGGHGLSVFSLCCLSGPQ